MKCNSCNQLLDFRVDCWMIPHIDKETGTVALDSEGSDLEFEHWVCPICGWETA